MDIFKFIEEIFGNHVYETYWSPRLNTHIIHVSMGISPVWQAHCSQVHSSQRNNTKMTMYLLLSSNLATLAILKFSIVTFVYVEAYFFITRSIKIFIQNHIIFAK